MEHVPAIVAMVWAGAVGATLGALRWVRTPLPDAQIVLWATTFETSYRRHSVVTIEQLALALTEDDFVRHLLRSVVDVDEFCRVLTTKLDQVETTSQPTVFDTRLAAIIADGRSRRMLMRCRPVDLLWSILLRDGGHTRDWLYGSGMTIERLHELEKTAKEGSADDVAEPGSKTHGSPYRSVDAEERTISFHNDPKTPAPFVIDALLTELGRDLTPAAHIAATVHVKGSACAAVLPREQAETAVARISERARKAGHPLRVEAVLR